MWVVEVAMKIMHVFTPVFFLLFASIAFFSKSALANSDLFKNVIFVGNSITKHPPSKKWKWVNNWGMAASKEENDYVHLLIDGLQSRGYQATEKIFSVAPLERGRESAENFVRKATQDYFDLIVVQIGDNVNKSQKNIDRFMVDYETVLSGLMAKNNHAVLRCIGLWWGGGELGNRLKDICESFGGVFIDVSDISSNNDFRGVAAYPGFPAAVKNHPGDLGMHAIYQRIMNSIFLED